MKDDLTRRDFAKASGVAAAAAARTLYALRLAPSRAREHLGGFAGLPLLLGGLALLMVPISAVMVSDPIYQAIADNLETFLERLRFEGHELPKYVVEEFTATSTAES